MNTKTLIEASATITTVTGLAKGDVYKRLEPKTAYSSAKLHFGVVTDVLFNGEEAAVTALEYENSYSAMEVTQHVYGTSDDLLIFAATREEFRAHVDDLINATGRKVKSAEAELNKAKESAKNAAALLNLVP